MVDQTSANERARIAKIDGLAVAYAYDPVAMGLIKAAKEDGRPPGATAMELLDTCGAPLSKPDVWNAEWSGSTDLQAEFPTAGAYVAFKKDEQRSRRDAR